MDFWRREENSDSGEENVDIITRRPLPLSNVLGSSDKDSASDSNERKSSIDFCKRKITGEIWEITPVKDKFWNLRNTYIPRSKILKKARKTDLSTTQSKNQIFDSKNCDLIRTRSSLADEILLVIWENLKFLLLIWTMTARNSWENCREKACSLSRKSENLYIKITVSRSTGFKAEKEFEIINERWIQNIIQRTRFTKKYKRRL